MEENIVIDVNGKSGSGIPTVGEVLKRFFESGGFNVKLNSQENLSKSTVEQLNKRASSMGKNVVINVNQLPK